MLLRTQFVFFVSILLIGCQTSPKTETHYLVYDSSSPKGIVFDNPVHQAVFPPEMPAPLFRWRDTLSASGGWDVFVVNETDSVLLSLQVEHSNWQPDSVTWEKLKVFSLLYPVKVMVVNQRKGLFSRGSNWGFLSFSTSPDSVGAGIFFRAVPLPFSYAVKNTDQIKWYMSRVEDKSPKLMLEKMSVCANCHSFSKNGDKLAMDVDYANDKGSYAISPINNQCMLDFDHIITWSDFQRNDGEDTYGLLSQISPDGKNVLSTVKDRSVFVALPDVKYSQLFFPVKGIIANYNKLNGQIAELPGANNRLFVQSNPVWSPDGEKIIFARAARYQSAKIDESKSVLLSSDDAPEFISGSKTFKFNLYQVDFNQGKGGEPFPLEGAANNGMSNYFPRYSPDGRWVVFCIAPNFMLLQPESKLYIMPAIGGVPRLMNCNSSDMNSWHSWSPNGKWLVFSSKRAGAYTKIYLTHIDANGNDSPPVLLENMAFDSLAVNIPEFYPGNFDKFNAITDHFSQTSGYYSRMASQCIRSGDYTTALLHIGKAIELDPKNYTPYIQRIKVNELVYQGNRLSLATDKINAEKLMLNKLQSEQNNPDLWSDYIGFLLLLKQYDKATSKADEALRKFPDNCDILNMAASAYRLSANYARLINIYNRLQKSCPESSKQTSFFLAIALYRSGEKSMALQVLTQLIDKYPADDNLYLTRAGFYNDNQDFNSALNDLNRSIELNPQNYLAFKTRMEFYQAQSKFKEAENDRLSVLTIMHQKLQKNAQIGLLFERAEMYQSQNNIHLAITDYKTILEKWPVNYLALKKLAQIYFEQSETRLACDAYQKLLAEYEAEAEFYNNLGLISIRTNNPENALDYFTKALAIEPENIDILYNRAYFYFSSRREKEALNDLNQLKKLVHKVNTNQKSEQYKQVATDANKMIEQLINKQ